MLLKSGRPEGSSGIINEITSDGKLKVKWHDGKIQIVPSSKLRAVTTKGGFYHAFRQVKTEESPSKPSVAEPRSTEDGFLNSWTVFTTQMVEAGARQEDLEESYLLEILDDVSPGKILEAFDMLPIPDIIRAVLPSRGQLMVALDGSDNTHKSALMACSTWMSQDPKDYEKLSEDITLLQGLRPKKKLKLTRLRKWHVQSNGTVSIMDMETFSKRFQNLIDELL